jgi:hypothetical protein
MIGNHQYGIANGHSSSLLAPTGGESAVLRRQIGVLCTTGGMRCLDESRPQPRIALGCLGACAFSSTLVIARTSLPKSPGAYRWGSGLSQSRSRLISPPLYAAPLPQSSPIAQVLLRKGASARQSPHSAALWSHRESRGVCQLLGNEKALVRSGASSQSPLQLRDLRPQLTHGQLGHCGSVRRALDQSF